VADYADALGITPSHLNTVCKQLTGKSTLEVVHERLGLAARRELAYTERNIAGVAHRLGFEDPSYFTRFFKRETGVTPGEFRRRSGTHDANRQAQ
jgi:AraC family transcriptional activator of pobA